MNRRYRERRKADPVWREKERLRGQARYAVKATWREGTPIRIPEDDPL